MAAKIIQGDFHQNPIIVGDGFVDQYEKKSHAADPITCEDMITEISEYFIKKGKLRNNLIFILGCNCGLRCGEIVSLKWGQLIDDSGTIKTKVFVLEEKTSKKNDITHDITKAKIREVCLNDAVKDAISLFMASQDTIYLTDYVFKSESNSAKYTSSERAAGRGAKHDHLTRQAVDYILKQTIKEALGYIDMNVSTHTMRKTFGRFVLMSVPENKRHDPIGYVQKMMGHAKPESTMHYLGITKEEIESTFMNLNLGKRKPSRVYNLEKNVR